MATTTASATVTANPGATNTATATATVQANPSSWILYMRSGAGLVPVQLGMRTGATLTWLSPALA